MALRGRKFLLSIVAARAAAVRPRRRSNVDAHLHAGEHGARLAPRPSAVTSAERAALIISLSVCVCVDDCFALLVPGDALVSLLWSESAIAAHLQPLRCPSDRPRVTMRYEVRENLARSVNKRGLAGG